MTSWIVSEDVLAQVPVMRDATRDDVPRIVGLFRTDELTRKHKGDDAPIEPGYYASFDAIAADPRNRLIVAECGGVVMGAFQLTLIPDMQPSGKERAIIENVIVDAASRGLGIGSAMMLWAVEEARRLGCGKISLTSNKQRAGAHRFYTRLGFVQRYEGFGWDLEEK